MTPNKNKKRPLKFLAFSHHIADELRSVRYNVVDLGRHAEV